jgi:hypothetical protein
MKKSIWLCSILFGVWSITVLETGLVRADEDHYQSAMGDIINSYLKIRNKLAADSLEGVAALAQKIIHQVQAVEKMHTKHPKHKHNVHKKYQLITEAGKHAAHLTHGDIKAVRQHFAGLSKPIIKYVEMFGQPHNIDGELFTYYCPMYPGYWVQESKDAANPFYGRKMLKCADLVEGAEKKQKMLHELGGERHQHMEGMKHEHM